MPKGSFVPTPVTSPDGKNTWVGRGRKPAWLKALEAVQNATPVSSIDSVAADTQVSPAGQTTVSE